MSVRYLCDPDRNRKCSKALCFRDGGPCGLTDDSTAAARDLLGNPIRAVDPNTIELEDNDDYSTKKKHGR